MNVESAIRKSFFRRLIATPKGRAHVLNLMIVGEEADEVGMFDRLAALSDHDAGRKAALHHKADEERHAALFRACLARTGVTPRPIPERLMLIRRIVRKSEDRFAQVIDAGSADGIADRRDLMNSYAMLQAIEERALKQFPALARLFRESGDAETAAVFEQVTEDERRHVQYCVALGRRYAPDASSWESALARYRAIEAEAFREVGLTTLADALVHDLVGLGVPGRLLGVLLNRLDRRREARGQVRPLQAAMA